MSLRSLKGIAVGLCLLVALASAYHVGAAPPPPVKGPAGANGTFAVSEAQMTLPPRVSRSIASAAATTMQENFEGAWPAAGWDLADQSNIDGGEYLWGKRNCHPHTGSFGAWAVGGGAQGSQLNCSADYPNNVLTWARYGPFDLSEATSARLTYHFWGQLEGVQGCAFDQFFVGSAINGTQFNGTVRCGDWSTGSAGNGYHQATLDLSNRIGQPQVWIAFAFDSDVSNTASGITIDDISLDIDTEITPTSTPSPTRTSTPTSTPKPTGTATATPPGASTTPTQSQAPDKYHLYLPSIRRAPELSATPTSTGIPPTFTPTNTPTNTPTSTPTQTSGYSGTWSGATSQDRGIAFTVANNAITYLSIGFRIPGCTITVFNYSTTPITNNTFTVSGSGGGTNYVVVGTFTSPTAASGTLQVSQNSQFCNGSTSATWTAAKQ